MLAPGWAGAQTLGGVYHTGKDAHGKGTSVSAQAHIQMAQAKERGGMVHIYGKGNQINAGHTNTPVGIIFRGEKEGGDNRKVLVSNLWPFRSNRKTTAGAISLPYGGCQIG